MIELKKITVCQSTVCQDKGSKGVLHRLEKQYAERFSEVYPDLIIEPGDCQGDCEQGPIVKVNDSILLREVDNQMAQEILEDPDGVLSDLMHVQEDDRETFERIINGDLY